MENLNSKFSPSTAITPAAATRLAWNVLNDLGIDVLFRIQRTEKGYSLVCYGVDPQFEQHYSNVVERGQDPFIRHCFDRPSTFLTGADFAPGYDELQGAERKFISEAFDGTGAAAGIAPFVSLPQDVRWNLLSTHWKGRDAIEIAQRSHDRLIDALLVIEAGVHQAPEILSRRERECLALVAEGLRVGQISVCLNIAPVTVEHHLRQARVKLGAKTRDHAVALALSANLIAIEKVLTLIHKPVGAKG